MAPKIPDSVRVAEAAALTRLYESQTPRPGHGAFGKRHHIGTAGAVWQYLNNRRPLNLEAATKFAQGIGCPIDAFSPRLAAAAALARGAGKNHMAIVSDATYAAHKARERPPALDWPFQSLDLDQIRKLKPDELLRLEGAWIQAAANLGHQLTKRAAA